MGKLKVQARGGFRGAKLASQGKLKVQARKVERQNNGSALGYLGTKTVYGLAGLVEGFSDFVRGSIYQLSGDKEYAQYLHEKDIVGEWTAKLDREYNPTGAMRVAGDIATGIGQALPSVALGVATAGASTAAQVAGAAGQAAVTMAYMGRGTTDAVKTTGELGAKENKYGIASGLLEGVTDKFLGGAQVAGKALVTAGKSATKAAAGKVARNTLMKHMLSAAGSEALEEFVQEYADTYLRRKTGVDKDAQTSLSDAMYSALIGGLTGGFLGGAAGSVNAAMNIRRGESVKARGLENSLLATANYIRKDYIGEKANFDNIQSASLRALSASVDAYDKLSDKSGTRASMLLGEIQMATLAFESEVGVRRVMNQMMQNPTEALAAHASTVMGRPVTVEELRNNVDGITEQLAVQSFATGALTESNPDRMANAVRDRVERERYMHVREGASFDGTLSAEGELVYRMNDGRYAIVTADQREGNEGKYRVGFSATPEYDPDDILMSQKSATIEGIREGLKGLADGTYVVGENGLERAQTSKNAPASDGDAKIEQTPTEIANEAQRAENTGEGASDNDSGRHALPKTREAKERKRKRAQEHQRQSREKRKAERMAEAMREEVVRNVENVEVNAEQGTEAAQETVEKAKIPARGYTDAEANDARALVKDFDLLPASTRRAIVELMRSGKASGASKNFLRHSANLIAYWRKGLWIIADSKTRDDGFYYVLDDGTRLITVNPKKEAKAVSETLMHELAHDVWARADAKTRKTLYGLATAGVDQKEIEEIREQYRTELTQRGELTKHDADGNTVDMTEAEINAFLDEEVATNLLGEAIGTEEFLSRFDGEGKFAAAKRIWRTLYNMKKRFTGKDKFLYRKADDLFKQFTKVMAVEEVEGSANESSEKNPRIRHSLQEIVGDSGKKYGIGVYLDSTLLTNLSDDERVQMVKEYVKELGGEVFTAYDGNNNVVNIHLVESSRKFKNKSGRRVPVNKDMTNYLNSQVKQEAIALIDELIIASTYRGTEPANHPHDWVDNNGHNDWDVWTTYLQDKENTVWEAQLRIANSTNGEKILYDIFPIKMVEQPSTMGTSTTNNSIAKKTKLSTTSAKKVSGNNGTGRKALSKKPKSQTTEKKARLTKEEKADEYKKVMDTIDENEDGYHTRLDYQKISEALDRRAKEKAKAQAKAKTQRPPEDEITRENFEKAVAAERERLEREAAARILAAEKGAKNATKNAEKRLEAEKNRIEKEASVLFNRTSREISKLDKNLQYLKHMASHQRATDGSIAAAVLLNDPVLQKFVSFLGKRGSAWGVMHKSTREGVREFLSWYKEDNAVLNDETVDKLYDDMGLKSDAIFGHYSAEIRAKMERIANGEGNLTAAELSDLAEVVNSIGRLYMTYGKVKVGGRWVDAKELAREHYAERSEARRILVAGRDIDGKPGAIKKLWQVLGSVKEGYLYSVVTPEVVLKDLEGNVKGGVLSSLYREIRLGEAEAKKIRVEILKPVAEFFEEHKAYRKKLSTDRRFEVNGLKLTTAQAVGLWETSKREHAQQRLFDTENGGIYAAVPDEEGNITSRNTKVTRADVENLFHEFTEEDIAYINALEESFRIATKYKEQTDGEVWGYTNVIKGHYYPITADENYFSRDITDARDAMRTIEVVNNKSFNKNTVDGAQAWLFIEDSLKVLERHSLGIGTYSGLYLPLKAFGQVYGAKFNKAGAPTDKGDADVLLMESAVGKTSLRQYYNAIWSKHGKSGGNLDQYLAKLFSDIQGITGEVSGIDRVVNRLQGGMVVSSFGLNAKVILTQLASYGAAYKNLDADVLVQAVTMPGEGEMMDKYSKLTLARDFDGVGAAEVLLDKISDFGRKTTKGIDFTDRQVILALYNACRLQVEKDGDGALGDEANYKKAAEMLDNLLLDTQTTSLKSDASALMRDKSLVAKMFTMFRTESMKSFSNFYTSIAAYANHRQYANAGLEGYSEMLDEDKKRIGKMAGAFLLSTAWVSALSIAFSRIRKKARGEEEEEKLVKQAAKEITDNVVELLPIISDGYSFLVDGYELESIPIATMNDALTSLRGVGILFDRTATDAEKNKYIRNSAYSVGSLVGIPSKNADRIGLAILTATNQSTAYLWNDRFKTAPTYEKDLEKALSSGNERLAGTILSAWWKSKKGGKSSDTVTQELLRLYTLKDGNGKEIFSMPKSVPSSLDQKTAAAFSSVYAGADAEVVSLIGSKAYEALDDAAKAKAVKACYDIHWSRAAQAVGLESTGSAARLAFAEGVDPAILAAVTGYASAHTGENRKAHIIQYLISLGVSLQDRNKYLAALGYKVS